MLTEAMTPMPPPPESPARPRLACSIDGGPSAAAAAAAAAARAALLESAHASVPRDCEHAIFVTQQGISLLCRRCNSIGTGLLCAETSPR